MFVYASPPFSTIPSVPRPVFHRQVLCDCDSLCLNTFLEESVLTNYSIYSTHTHHPSPTSVLSIKKSIKLSLLFFFFASIQTCWCFGFLITFFTFLFLHFNNITNPCSCFNNINCNHPYLPFLCHFWMKKCCEKL